MARRRESNTGEPRRCATHRGAACAGDFLTRSRTTSADPFVYTQRYNAQAMKQREIGYGDSSRSGDEMMPAKEGSQGLLSSEQQV